MIEESTWKEVAALRDSRAIRVKLGWANAVGGALVGVVGVVIGLPDTAGSITAARQGLISSLAGVTYLAGALVIASRSAVQRTDRVFSWIDERREPTLQERREALRVPWVNARQVFGWWCGAAVMFFVLNLLYRNPLAFSGRLALNVVLGGAASAVLAYLLLERYSRPAFRIVLETAELRGGGLDLRRRFVLTWLLSAAVPLVIMATAPVGLSRADRADLLGPLLVLLVIGLMTGWVLTIVLARSVTDPLNAVRAAQLEVRGGNLDAEVAVDDGGEVGLLQAEFNRMVEGLRERAQLQDLFGRHVGSEVAQLALARGVHLGGERRSASVLFIDLTGSTAMTERLAPEAVVAILNDVFGAVVSCTRDERGWVNKFEGDAALCVFGPPGTDTGHAAAALRAARALRCEIGRLAEKHDGLDAGIGISSGEVVAGNIGAADRYEYTVIGDPVNEAARLTDRAKSEPSRVLASRPAIEAAGDEGRAAWQQVGTMQLRGRTTPTDVFAPAV